MRYILFLFLTFLYFNSFSQTFDYYDDKISSTVYSIIDSNSKLICCSDAPFKKKSQSMTYEYSTVTTCFDEFKSLDDYYSLAFDESYIECLSADIARWYFKSFSYKKRSKFSSTCYKIHKTTIIEDDEDWGFLCHHLF